MKREIVVRKKKFTVVLKRDEERCEAYNVTVPALPGCLTWGVGEERALMYAAEAIELCLDAAAKPKKK